MARRKYSNTTADWKQTAGGGRKKGVKNIEKTSTGYRNRHGVEFSEADKKALVSAVNSAERKRKRMLEQASKLEKLNDAGEPVGASVLQSYIMGKEHDFILTQKTKSLQRFTSREQFDRYLDYLHQVNKRDYVDKRVELYRENHVKAIEQTLGDSELAQRIKDMSLKDYTKLVMQHEDTMEIHFIYDNKNASAKSNQIRRVLKMHPLESDMDDEFIE